MGGNQLLELIGAGTSLVVGTVSRDAEPRAARAWASSVVATEPLRVRVLMSADDPEAVANLETGNVSLTGADVPTLQSAQLKGTVVLVEPATPSGPRARRHAHGRLLPGGAGDRRLPVDADAPAAAARGGRLRDGGRRDVRPVAGPGRRRRGRIDEWTATSCPSARSSAASPAPSRPSSAPRRPTGSPTSRSSARRSASTTNASPCPTSSCPRRRATSPTTPGRACS